MSKHYAYVAGPIYPNLGYSGLLVNAKNYGRESYKDKTYAPTPTTAEYS